MRAIAFGYLCTMYIYTKHTMVTRSLARGKVAGACRLPPTPIEAKRKSKTVPALPLWAFMACYRVNFAICSTCSGSAINLCLYKSANVLYGCETWSLTLREERRLRVFENRVLRRVFGPKRGEVTG